MGYLINKRRKKTRVVIWDISIVMNYYDEEVDFVHRKAYFNLQFDDFNHE